MDRQAARRIVNELLMTHPDGHDLSLPEQGELLAAYGIELWETLAGRHPRGGARPRARRSAGTSCSRPRPTTCGTGPTSPTSGATSTRPAEMARRVGRRSTSSSPNPSTAGFVVQKNAPPGVPVGISSMEDPLFGPVLSFGIGGPLTELLGDRSFRIPPLAEHDAQDMVREIKASPILFGYRGSEIVDVTEIERLVRRVAQIQNDLPQVRALDLPLDPRRGQRGRRARRRDPDRAGPRSPLRLVRPAALHAAGRHAARLSLSGSPTAGPARGCVTDCAHAQQDVRHRASGRPPAGHRPHRLLPRSGLRRSVLRGGR